MRIKVEPKEFFMYSVFLAFDGAKPDLEDEAVKAYLDQHELIAKAQGKQNWDGQEFDVMYFGGCYLGRHLKVVEDIQRGAIEQEMLAEEISRAVEGATDPATRSAAANIPEPRLREVISSLVQEFHQESSFGEDEEGYLKVTLEPALIERKFVEKVGETV